MVKNRLFTKFLRDLRHSKGQLLSVMLLSMLGVWVFSGLDIYWRNLDVSIESYFDEQKLADFWVITPLADKDSEEKIRSVDGVEDLMSRLSYEVSTAVPEDAKLVLHAVGDDIDINIPRITSGGPLWDSDSDGCLLDVRFAEANGLAHGDSIVLKIGEEKREFVIRGLVMSPEHVYIAQDVIPEPKIYGFAYVNKAAFPNIPSNEICVLLSDDADTEEAKAAIEDKLPGAFIQDRRSHKSTQLISTEVSQFRSLSKVFPVMFFAVSALIVMTAMTRIVSNQRTQLGLLKALGYGKGTIVLHYMSFGFFPSLGGAAGGLALGRNTLPAFLWNILDDIYILPDVKTAPLSAATLTVCMSSVLLTCIICWCACRRSAAETSASLLRPKAPASGSRILLERISPIWERLSFSAKMIQRNLLRNKIRTIMALSGVLSCTALIITALGLLDSVDHMVDTYYGETLKFDLRADLDEGAGSAGEYRRLIDAGKVEGIMEMAASIRKTDGNGSRAVLLTVVENDHELLSLDTAGTSPGTEETGKNGRNTRQSYPADSYADDKYRIGIQDNRVQHDMPDTGAEYETEIRHRESVIASEKLAQVMGISAGDILKLKLPGAAEEVEVFVERLVPVPIGQGIYMYERSWNSLKKGEFTPTALLIRNPCKEVYDLLEGLDEVTCIKSLQTLRDKTKEGLESLTGVSVLMVAFALVLAFVVLYNMGILNFMERVREFATLKVLGFRHREIRSLIVKENIIIAVTGILAGIYPGVRLTDIVMKSSEPEDMVFSAVAEPTSILAACCITFVFSLLVQYMLAGKVRSIVMTEALKSVE